MPTNFFLIILGKKRYAVHASIGSGKRLKLRRRRRRRRRKRKKLSPDSVRTALKLNSFCSVKTAP
jgi:hypothetical protein